MNAVSLYENLYRQDIVTLEGDVVFIPFPGDLLGEAATGFFGEGALVACAMGALTGDGALGGFFAEPVIIFSRSTLNIVKFIN